MKNSKENILSNEAIIIELVGPPGAGKTTNCGYFAAALQERGIKVFTLQDLKDHIHSLDIYSKLYLFMTTLFLKSHVLGYYTYKLALCRIFSINSIYRYLRLLIFNQALEKAIKSQNIDVVILDQWGIQEIWSATIFKSNAFELLADKLSEFYFDTDYVMYFDIDVPTASERINKRKTNLSRFDRMSSEKRLRELMKYNTYLYKLFEKSDCSKKYIFKTAHTPFEVAALFMQHLELNTVKKV